MARIWNKPQSKASSQRGRHKQLNTTFKPEVFVAMYTNEGLKFQVVLGPLKFEPLRRGRPTRSTSSGQAIMV